MTDLWPFQLLVCQCDRYAQIEYLTGLEANLISGTGQIYSGEITGLHRERMQLVSDMAFCGIPAP